MITHTTTDIKKFFRGYTGYLRKVFKKEHGISFSQAKKKGFKNINIYMAYDWGCIETMEEVLELAKQIIKDNKKII